MNGLGKNSSCSCFKFVWNTVDSAGQAIFQVWSVTCEVWSVMCEVWCMKWLQITNDLVFQGHSFLIKKVINTKLTFQDLLLQVLQDILQQVS